jgi:hypothetical protein
MTTELGVCISCERPILWVRAARSGRPIPLDRQPVDDGTVRIARGGKAHVFRDAGAAREAGHKGLYPERYRSHHSTCPKASAHRRRERSAA